MAQTYDDVVKQYSDLLQIPATTEQDEAALQQAKDARGDLRNQATVADIFQNINNVIATSAGAKPAIDGSQFGKNIRAGGDELVSDIEANQKRAKEADILKSAKTKSLADTLGQYEKDVISKASDTTKLNLDQQMADPNSDISKFAKERAAVQMKSLKSSFDPRQLDGMSAAQLEKLGFKAVDASANSNATKLRFERIQEADGTISTYAIDPQTGEKLQKIGNTGFATQFRTDPGTQEIIGMSPSNPAAAPKAMTGPAPKINAVQPEESIKLDKSFLNKTQKDQVDTYRKAYHDDVQDNIQGLGAVSGIKNLLNAPSDQKMNQDVMRAFQNQFAKASGETGVMTEGDVKPYGGRQDILSRLERFAKMNTVGQLPAGDRQFLLQLAEVMGQRHKDFINKRADFYADNLTSDLKSDPSLGKLNFGKDSARDLIGQSSLENTFVKGPAAKNEIKRRAPNGKIAVFDQNKKFLRYEE